MCGDLHCLSEQGEALRDAIVYRRTAIVYSKGLSSPNQQYQHWETEVRHSGEPGRESGSLTPCVTPVALTLCWGR